MGKTYRNHPITAAESRRTYVRKRLANLRRFADIRPYDEPHERRKYEQQYDRLARDGGMNDTSRKQDYKKRNTNLRRTTERKVVHDIMKFGSYDKPYPTAADGKYMVWSFW